MLLEIELFKKKKKKEGEEEEKKRKEKKRKKNQTCIMSGLSQFLFLQQKM